MRDYFNSVRVLAIQAFRRSWPVLVLLFLDAADLYERYLHAHLPGDFWPETVGMSEFWQWFIFGLVLLWAMSKTYHEERTRKEKLKRQVGSRLNYVAVTIGELATEGRRLREVDIPEENLAPAIQRWRIKVQSFLDTSIGEEESERFVVFAAMAYAAARAEKDWLEVMKKIDVAVSYLNELKEDITEKRLRPELEVPDSYLDRVSV